MLPWGQKMTDFIQACIKANEEIVETIKDGFDASWFEKTVLGAGGDVSSKLDLMAVLGGQVIVIVLFSL